MSPLFDLECLECGNRQEVLVKDKEELSAETCKSCQSKELQVCMSGISNYTIKGNNSASTRPIKSRSTK